MNESPARQTATRAEGQRFNLGPADYDLNFELAEFEAEQEAEKDKWEREGRAEMYATLGLTDY